jgi:hypothetical protein
MPAKQSKGWFNLRGHYITILWMIIFKKIPCYLKNLLRLLRRWPHEEAPTCDFQLIERGLLVAIFSPSIVRLDLEILN